MPPSYRDRLRVEGLTLAGCGLAGSAALLAFTEQSRRRPASTVVQLGVAAALIAALGPRGVRRALAEAEQVAPGQAGTGEPTPLWHVPLVMAGLVASVVVPRELGSRFAGWDAALRVTGGCTLVGLAQALALERMVAADERRTGRTYVRLPGSRLGRRTRLGWSRGRPA
jgi:hypothetical protein